MNNVSAINHRLLAEKTRQVVIVPLMASGTFSGGDSILLMVKAIPIPQFLGRLQSSSSGGYPAVSHIVLQMVASDAEDWRRS
jgi:hypothetical protein